MAVGFGSAPATAAAPAPGVAVGIPASYLAGEDLAVDITFTSAGPAAGPQYNLSAAVLVPEGVSLVGTGTLGSPIEYPKDPAERVIPGGYASVGVDCAALGLEPASSSLGCEVPEGKRLLVFQNISDLPVGASATHRITLRPDAAEFGVGTDALTVDVAAYTSSAPRLIPLFPGSTGLATSTADTSAPGFGHRAIPVQAVRLEKSESSPEGELLRGVHDNATTYTLRIWHTGEGDVTDVRVVDFLPAGLEYLGLGGVDNTSDANGTRDEAAEYPGAASLANTPAPDPTLNVAAAATTSETVETVIPTAAEVARYGLQAGRVYTKVTWSLADLLAAGGAYDIEVPSAQDLTVSPQRPGEPGYVELRYRAAVPLFENTLDFDGAGGQPGITGEQTANLDNNRGASTRHGSVQTTPGLDDDGSARALTNVAGVSGSYTGLVAAEEHRATSDHASLTVDAVDVRVRKSVDDSTFQQGTLARYTLLFETSEYTSAALGADGAPNRVIDDLGDGICPALPAGSATPGVSSAGADIPRLVIGDPRVAGGVGPDLTAADWNDAVGLGSACAYPSAEPSASLSGATVDLIAFDPDTGHFIVAFTIPELAAGDAASVSYTAQQNSLYARGGHAPGATTSGDEVPNTVEFMMTTTSIPALAGIASAGDAANAVAPDVADGVWRAWDDSAASVRAELTRLTKHVLTRSAGVPDRALIADQPESAWVKTADENEPFAVGDEVWYRLQVIPPSGADVRNPLLTDFLPAGVAFDPVPNAGTGRPENVWIVPSSPTPSTPHGLGSCTPATALEWLDTFVPVDGITVDGNLITFQLGADDCFGAGVTDRFLPLATTLQVFIKVTVVNPAAFATVDLPENLAKYQQNNVDGEVFFLRDAAEIEVDGGPGLVKGIRTNSNPGSGSTGSLLGYYPYNSDVDGGPAVENVVQGNEVTFRLDVSSPRASTSGYLVWDALPAGMTKAELRGFDPGTGTFDAAAVRVQQSWVPPQGADPGFWSPVETPVPSGWTATAYDPGDAGYPDEVRDEIRDAGRTVVVWTFDGVVPGSLPADEALERPAAFQGISLSYTVVVPDGTNSDAAELTQRYVNDASIVRFAYEANTGTPTPIIVNGGDSVAEDRVAGPGEYVFDDTNGVASDPSQIYVVGTDVTKRLLSTEVGPAAAAGDDGTVGLAPIDAGNAQGDIVQGELATFELAVTIPAHTTVRGAELADDGHFVRSGTDYSYEFVGARYLDPSGAPLACGGTAADFRCTDAAADGRHGVLTFPDEYTNATNDPQTFRVEVTVWMSDRDAAHPAPVPNLSNGWVLTNTARFSFIDPNGDGTTRIGYDDTASVRYEEPNLAITKTASKTDDVTLDDTVTYTLTVTNTGSGRPKSYENTVVDTVPAGLRVDPSSFRIGSNPTAPAGVVYDAGVTTGLGGTITWAWDAADLGELAEVPASVELRYSAQLDPSTGGGRSYENRATVTGYTLPSTVLGDDTTGRRGVREASATREITATTATIAKGVRVSGDTAYASGVSAPVGETVQYAVDVTLNPSINYYDVRVSDVLPAGLSLQGTPQVHLSTGGGAPVDVTADWTASTSGQTTTWTYTRAGAGGDLLQDPLTRVLTFSYEALITDAVATGTPTLTNTATFAWAPSDGGSLVTPAPSATADVTLQNPSLSVQKRVMRATGDSYGTSKTGPVDASFSYRVRVTNASTPAGTRSPAYNVTVTDTVPAGIVIDTASLSVPSGTVTHTPGVATGAGGTITWTFDGPLAPGATADLEYAASFVPSAELTAGAKQNTARVTEYESFPTGGRSYGPSSTSSATVTPQFPNVELTKQVADPSRNAYAGEPFEWILTATNAGTGAAQKVVLTDTLPENWTFTAVTSITVGGVAVAATAPSGGPDGPLVWTFGEDAVAGDPAAILPAGQSIVIRYTATPTDPDALVSPGVGTDNPHVNTLSASATDRRNATGNADGSYAGDPVDDEAFLRVVDLRLQKEAIGGVIALQTDDDNPLRNVPVGSWVAGQAAVAGQYATPQWRITVTNAGPDAGFGPFQVIDTTTLPAGVSVGSWSARLYADAADTVGQPLSLTGTGTSADPFVVGGAATSLAAGGGARIELLADVTIAADTEPGAIAENTASVTGRTYERPADLDDNEDDAEKEITAVADLRIVKTVANPAPASVGEGITWNLTVTNLGPSISRSDATRITVSDTVPAGVGSVTAAAVTDWPATATRTGTGVSFPVEAGDVVTWTHEGDALDVGASVTLTLSGTVLSSHTGALTNTATVSPGDTPDPATPNNSDDVTVTPNDETVLDITKTRVVWDAATSSWVPAAGLTPVPAVVPGERVHYLVTVSNTGVADARSVVVVDEVPAGLSYDSHASVGSGSWTHAAGGTTSTGTAASWSTFTLAGTLPAGESRAMVAGYDVASDVDPTTPILNCVETTADNWLQSAATHFDRACDSSASDRIVDLGIAKTHADAPGAPGETRFAAGTVVSYTLTVTNHGPSATGGPIVITDELPSGMTLSGTPTVSLRGAAPVAAAPTVSAGGRMLTWSVMPSGLLDVDETIVVRVDALIDPLVRADVDLSNTATVEGPETEPVVDPNPNTDTDTVTTFVTAPLDIAKGVETGPWVAGTDVEYTLTITNAGPSAVPASVTETLPTGLTLRSMSGTDWDCSSVTVGASTGECSYSGDGGLLVPGTSTITVVARIGADVAAGTILSNEVTLRWTDSDGPHESDDDEPITVSAVADLALDKAVREDVGGTTWLDAQDAASAGRVVAGAETEFRLRVSNLGPSDAVAPLEVTDTLPSGAHFVGIVGPSDWTAVADAAAGTVTFTRDAALGGLAVGATPLEIVYTVGFDPELAIGAVLTNTAELTAATLAANADPNAANDADPANVEVDREVDVEVAKSHLAGSVRIGDPLSFDIVVTNNGPSEASGVVVTDTVPAGLEVVSAPGDPVGLGWTLVSVTLVDPADPAGGAVLVAQYADPLAPGGATTAFSPTVLVTDAAYPEVVNTAEVTVTETDIDPLNDRVEDRVEVPPMVTLVIEKTAVGTFQVGKRGTYTITVENLGPTDEPGPVTVEDVLPAGLRYAASPENPTVVGSTVTWTIPAIPMGDTVTLTLHVDVGSAAYPEVTNVATVTTPSELTPASVTDDDELVAVAAAPLLPFTGAEPELWVLLALVLLALGATLVIVRRRRVG